MTIEEVFNSGQTNEFLKCQRCGSGSYHSEAAGPLVITQNNEAKIMNQDIVSYEETQESLALLKILALGNQQIEDGRVVPAVLALRILRQEKGRD